MNNQVSPYKTSLDRDNAYWMARLSKAVYIRCDESGAPDEEKILNILKQEDEGFISIFGANKNSAQAALIEHSNYLCIAFRGTDETLDWFDNLHVLATRQLFGEFHCGFWQSVEDVWSPLYERLLELREQKKRPLFLTGHSLGGAMATIAAAKLADEDFPFTSVYTFGQPRAMTRDTARIFNVECKARFYRFQNNNDIVTRLPARAMGYSHVGNYLYISEEKSIHQDAGFWFKFMDSIDGIVSAIDESGIDAIADHGMGAYLEAIQLWNYVDS